MTRAGWVVLACIAWAAAAEPPDGDLGPLLHDPAKILAIDHRSRLTTLIDDLEAAGVQLSVSVQRRAEAGETPMARDWLTAWEEREPAGDTPRLVLLTALDRPAAEWAANAAAEQRWPAATRATFGLKDIAAALALRDVGAVGRAVTDAVEALARTVDLPSASHAAAATNRDESVAATRPWLSPLTFIIAPVLLLSLLAWARLRGGVWRFWPWLVPLYTGLYLMMRFNPGLFSAAGALAVVPVIALYTTPAAPRERVVREPSRGGFGLTTFGAFGCDRAGRQGA